MYCTHCGAKFNDDARFCTYCGAAVESFEEQTGKTQSTSLELNTSAHIEDDLVKKQTRVVTEHSSHITNNAVSVSKKKNKKSRKGKILKIALSVIVIALIACGGVLWYLTHTSYVKSSEKWIINAEDYYADCEFNYDNEGRCISEKYNLDDEDKYEYNYEYDDEGHNIYYEMKTQEEMSSRGYRDTLEYANIGGKARVEKSHFESMYDGVVEYENILRSEYDNDGLLLRRHRTSTSDGVTTEETFEFSLIADNEGAKQLYEYDEEGTLMMIADLYEDNSFKKCIFYNAEGTPTLEEEYYENGELAKSYRYDDGRKLLSEERDERGRWIRHVYNPDIQARTYDVTFGEYTEDGVLIGIGEIDEEEKLLVDSEEKDRHGNVVQQTLNYTGTQVTVTYEWEKKSRNKLF